MWEVLLILCFSLLFRKKRKKKENLSRRFLSTSTEETSSISIDSTSDPTIDCLFIVSNDCSSHLLWKNTQVSNSSRPQAGHRPLDPHWKEPRFRGSPLEGTPVARYEVFRVRSQDRPLPPGNGKLPISRTFHISNYGRK